MNTLVPIYLGAVKLRTVDADKLGLATDGQAAGTAHTGSIHHDSIERNVCGKIIFLGQETADFIMIGGPIAKTLSICS